VTDRKSNYDKHNNSQKHILKTNATKLADVRPPEAEVSQPIQTVTSPHKCKYCEQCYRHKSSLSKHIKYTCIKNKNDITEVVRVFNKRLEQQEIKLEAQAKQIEELKRTK
jgi:hypothetical protein